jgi:hypothetical protein
MSKRCMGLSEAQLSAVHLCRFFKIGPRKVEVLRGIDLEIR